MADQEPATFNCDFCDKVLKSQAAKAYHLSKNVCGKVQLTEPIVHKPPKVKTGEFMCNKCGKEFKSSNAIVYHENKNVCVRRNERQGHHMGVENVDMHMITNQKIETKKKRTRQTNGKFICELCHMGYGSPQALKYHIEKGVCKKRKLASKVDEPQKLYESAMSSNHLDHQHSKELEHHQGHHSLHHQDLHHQDLHQQVTHDHQHHEDVSQFASWELSTKEET
uniref:C2H2-type domain-containing protein n=1 Tax=Mucochytrium quahogii TaxID=96639 RepID=A0A7S2RIG8_9STRA|mmetsp:Transcript_20032/g.33066  ORF Transcript_20032/g.33066 Transcript_20032/m.33066 type:complete len:223 (+) Transcript_20032:89-757(+)|eukprot:CAMPEP_0203759038 /NCGR_PEP_ID=MMETSP0098-20131031/11966_1 /ASSEMBLY_ACC=CAM_ASM_000208 /TAXON_ID=96639 /ORGANISM=" , Strain NY0313808BC1" /LENGTH=222 /DNA_ID=CAMNT_0050651767 /DNA_START=60 /DNA_END=728 /DNA_ORIENTATION=-